MCDAVQACEGEFNKYKTIDGVTGYEGFPSQQALLADSPQNTSPSNEQSGAVSAANTAGSTVPASLQNSTSAEVGTEFTDAGLHRRGDLSEGNVSGVQAAIHQSTE